MLVILLSGLVVVSSPFSASATHRLNIPNNLFTPPNQGQSVPKGQSIPQGLLLLSPMLLYTVLVGMISYNVDRAIVRPTVDLVTMF